jgi:predicted DNA-binding ArsR family transcriptional regulator
MKESTRQKIQEAINDIKELGGLSDPKMKEVVDKLKKVLKEDEKSKK